MGGAQASTGMVDVLLLIQKFQVNGIHHHTHDRLSSTGQSKCALPLLEVARLEISRTFCMFRILFNSSRDLLSELVHDIYNQSALVALHVCFSSILCLHPLHRGLDSARPTF